MSHTTNIFLLYNKPVSAEQTSAAVHKLLKY